MHLEIKMKRKIKICSGCDNQLTKKTAASNVIQRGYGYCRQCHLSRQRRFGNHKPLNLQIQKTEHVFPCGCMGVLPEQKQSNIFAKWSSHGWSCRVSTILNSSRAVGIRYRHIPINSGTPHSIIRTMMDKPNCGRCGIPLKWEFGKGKTPHLHHNHETGKIYGFTHPRCNPHVLEQEIDRLKDEIARLTAHA
jgi:hypothetical protein